MMEQCSNGFDRLLVGIPRPTKISISHRRSFHQHSLLEIIQDKWWWAMGLCPFSQGPLELSLPSKHVWTLYSRNVETHGNSNVSCHLTGVPSISSRETWAIVNVSVYLFQNPAFSTCNLTPLLPCACPLRMPVHGVDACFFRMSFACKLLPLQTAMNPEQLNGRRTWRKRNMWPAQNKYSKFDCTTLACSMYAINFTLSTSTSKKNRFSHCKVRACSCKMVRIISHICHLNVSLCFGRWVSVANWFGIDCNFYVTLWARFENPSNISNWNT